MGNDLSKKHADKLYEDGFRDAKHGAQANTPHQNWHPFMRDQYFKENDEYLKGYKAGKTSKE